MVVDNAIIYGQSELQYNELWYSISGCAQTAAPSERNVQTTVAFQFKWQLFVANSKLVSSSRHLIWEVEICVSHILRRMDS